MLLDEHLFLKVWTTIKHQLSILLNQTNRVEANKIYFKDRDHRYSTRCVSSLGSNTCDMHDFNAQNSILMDSY